MSRHVEALKLALECIEAWDRGCDRDHYWRDIEAAITAIREALADSALERMAQNERELGIQMEPPCKTGSQCTSKCQQCEQPAQQQEPVAVKQIAEALRQIGLTLVRTNGGFRVMDLGRIEAQTTSPQPAQQQPFGQVTVVRRPGFVDEYWFYRWPEPPYLDNAAECHMVYTSPQPSKPWVGLSTDEIYDMYNEPRSDAEMVEFARTIEAKLRGKNAQPSNPLTDEQITKHFQEHIDTGSLLSFADGVRFAEAAHGITGEQK